MGSGKSRQLAQGGGPDCSGVDLEFGFDQVSEKLCADQHTISCVCHRAVEGRLRGDDNEPVVGRRHVTSQGEDCGERRAIRIDAASNGDTRLSAPQTDSATRELHPAGSRRVAVEPRILHLRRRPGLAPNGVQVGVAGVAALDRLVEHGHLVAQRAFAP